MFSRRNNDFFSHVIDSRGRHDVCRYAAYDILLLIISVTHSTCGVLCTVVGGVCAAASTILAVAIAKFRS